MPMRIVTINPAWVFPGHDELCDSPGNEALVWGIRDKCSKNFVFRYGHSISARRDWVIPLTGSVPGDSGVVHQNSGENKR
jgi:hypothetical protein